jgi:hypothetical protein
MSPATAAEILERAGERQKWYRLLDSQDDSIVLRAMMYLTDRREGRPAQQVNITSQSVHLDVKDLERARAIVREIRGESSPNLEQAVQGNPKGLMPCSDKPQEIDGEHVNG